MKGKVPRSERREKENRRTKDEKGGETSVERKERKGSRRGRKQVARHIKDRKKRRPGEG